MRNGQNKHRMRGRNRGGKNHNPLTRVYESNGPDVKIRGTALHIAEKYVQLARDASIARAVLDARQSGRTVLLVAGFGHVRRDLGVPTWLPAWFTSKTAIAQAGQAPSAIESEANYIHATPALAPQDYCAPLRGPGTATPVR